MKRLQVFLCDLTHTGNKIGTSSMPFAQAETIPDVIGFSTYVWNDEKTTPTGGHAGKLLAANESGR